MRSGKAPQVVLLACHTIPETTIEAAVAYRGSHCVKFSDALVDACVDAALGVEDGVR